MPVGTWQAINSYTPGYWYAHSADSVRRKVMKVLVWAGMLGDKVERYCTFKCHYLSR